MRFYTVYFHSVLIHYTHVSRPVDVTAREQAAMEKIEKEKEEIIIPLEDLSPLAKPLAQKKLVKKLYKTIKKGVENLPHIVLFCFLTLFSI